MFKIDRQSGLEMSLECLAQLSEPEEVLLGPSGLGGGKDMAVVAQSTGDAVLGGSDLSMVTSPESQESAQGLQFLGGNVNRSQVSTTIKPGEHDGIKAISLAVITGFAGNERGSDDVTVKAADGERTLKNKSNTGNFIASPDQNLLGQATKELTDLHQVGREPENFRLVATIGKNGGSNRF